MTTSGFFSCPYIWGAYTSLLLGIHASSMPFKWVNSRQCWWNSLAHYLAGLMDTCDWIIQVWGWWVEWLCTNRRPNIMHHLPALDYGHGKLQVSIKLYMGGGFLWMDSDRSSWKKKPRYPRLLMTVYVVHGTAPHYGPCNTVYASELYIPDGDFGLQKTIFIMFCEDNSVYIALKVWNCWF